MSRHPDQPNVPLCRQISPESRRAGTPGGTPVGTSGDGTRADGADSGTDPPPSGRPVGVLLSVAELAPLLGLTRGGVRALLNRGDLPFVRIGRRMFVEQVAITRRFDEAERITRSRSQTTDPEPRRIVGDRPWTATDLHGLR